MSHLSILPTVFTRLDLLEAALIEEGFHVSQQTTLQAFDAEPRPVDLLAHGADGRPIGWTQGTSGVITMIGDLQRMSLQTGLPSRLQQLTRRYALLEAMDEPKSGDLQKVQVTVEPI